MSSRRGAGLLALIEGAGATRETTILVGDSRIDLQTARAAGTAVCLARYGFGYRFAPEDFNGSEHFIDRMTDLPEILTRAAGN